MSTLRALRVLGPFFLLAAVAACTDDQTVTPNGPAPGVSYTAPNPNNPYATDPMDPNMNPHYMRPHGR
jgi:hypothetical protein